MYFIILLKLFYCDKIGSIKKLMEYNRMLIESDIIRLVIEK